MNVMIFAAGFGTRMRPLTDHMPKAMVPLAQRPLIDWALDEAEAAQPRTLVVNGHYHADQLAKHLENRPNVTFVEETDTILETGGGLRNALPILGKEPVITLNSDAAWKGPRATDVLLNAWDPNTMDSLLLLVPKTRALGGEGGWKFSVDAHNITQLCAPDEKSALTYTGCAIVKTEGLAAIKKDSFSLRDLWAPMLETGRLGGVVYPGMWADVGTPEGLKRAEKMLADPYV